ncbi:MAG TPA: helix-turn-helix domain-containing protein [Mycobacterium sp.]
MVLISTPPLAGAHGGRAVLDGAFTVLETLSDAHHGLGLTDLARASGLAKTSAYRLAEQLVTVNAVQRVGHRYFIGPMIGRLGHCWQPDPLLRQACEEPVRRLSELTRATAAVYVLHERHARLVTATAPAGQSWIPAREFDADTTPHTAVGRVLLTAHPGAERPAAIPEPKWALWRAGIRNGRFAITESDRAPEGCCLAAAPIWRADRDCAGAAAVIPRASAPSRAVIDLLLATTASIGRALRSQQARATG